MPIFLILKMNSQRSETGLNWCSADWESCTKYSDCGFDGTNSASMVIAPSTCPHYRRSDKFHRCCKRSSAIIVRTPGTCPLCVSRGHPNAETGMAGRLSAGTSKPYWREAKGTYTYSCHPDLGVLTLLQNCLAITTTWMSCSSRAFVSGWMVYLSCYLILLSSGSSISHALEDLRQVRFINDRCVYASFKTT